MRVKNLFFLVIFTTLPFVSKGQVTIGSGTEPALGSILDIKEKKETTGVDNSSKGMIIPRVYLTEKDKLSPMLKGTDLVDPNLQQEHKGMILYNVNNTSPFTEGFYMWNGTKWISIGGTIYAHNGLSAAGDIIELGGNPLVKNTTINLGDHNLNFNSTSGNIGVNNNDPKAPLHVEQPTGGKDPIIINNIQKTSDPINSDVDDANSTYYELRVSSGGVLRKKEPEIVNPNQSYLFNLKNRFTTITGDNTGNGGTELVWSRNGEDYQDIELPEDGAYVFSFRLYGTTSSGTSSKGTTFYISAFKNEGSGFQLFDIAEIIVHCAGFAKATSTVNLTVTGKAKDKIRFKLSHVEGTNFTWTLLVGANLVANRTTMIYWKL